MRARLPILSFRPGYSPAAVGYLECDPHHGVRYHAVLSLLNHPRWMVRKQQETVMTRTLRNDFTGFDLGSYEDRPYTFKEMARITAGAIAALVIVGWIGVLALALLTVR